MTLRGNGGQPSAWKGAVAGTVGGLVASVLMNGFQQLWSHLSPDRSRRKPEQGGQLGKSGHERRPGREGETPTERAVRTVSRAVLHPDPPEEEKRRFGKLIHYGFGTVTGAVYGAAAELDGRVTAASGLPFGAAVWAAADEIGVPALGLSKPPDEYPLSVHAQSFVAHLVYGAATDIVRRIVRKAL